jgi:hypothetical protein
MIIGVPALYALFGPAVTEAWPQLVNPAFAGPAMTALVSAIPVVLVSAAIAYFVPDAPNIPSPREHSIAK